MKEIQLASVWSSIEELIEDGVSIIPVRDKDEGDKKAKTPCISQWKQYQTTRITKEELWQAMQAYNTTAVAVVCGEVSGRLELIDIDSKYEPGIDAILMQDLKLLYPHIFPLLRIHRTPSGGYHIIYRIEDGDVEGNQKLAGREATEAELEEQRKAGAKRLSKQVNFLETRGEGGYFLYPPSMGYEVTQDVPIPLLTWEERCSLINLCRSYDRIVKVEPTPKPTRKEDDLYTTNPFEDFNSNCDPVALFEKFGWKLMRHQTSVRLYFTRPGKDSGVSASFNREKRVFYVFTSSTELAPNRGYNPASILAELEFDGDRKKTFKHLIDQGYGIVKRQVEQALIKKAAIKGTSIPANFSEEAVEEHAQLSAKYQQEHPYGTFWEYNKQGDFVINVESLLTVAHELGFRSYNNGVVQINQRYVNKVDDVYFFDLLKDYIKEESPDIDNAIKNAYERFLKTYGNFLTTKRLQAFDTEEILQDSADTCYKFYANCYVEITATNVRIKPYEELTDGLVWSDKIMDREYQYENKASTLYQDYLRNATSVNGKDISDNVKNILGWLCHDYNSPARVYIIVLTEMVLDPKDGGGSGKNIFVNLLSNVIGLSTASGAMVKWDDKFFAVWRPGDRIYFIPDIPKKVDWPFLKNAVENPLVNKKYDREVSINTASTPKLVINTNFSYADSDGGLRRRIRPIEFTDFYTRNGGVDGVHGKLFPSAGEKGGWTNEDWKGFDDFIIHSIQFNLQQDGKIQSETLSKDGWTKKFINMYGEDNYDFIRDNIEGWVRSDYIKVNDFQRNYDDFVMQLKERYKLGKKTLLSAVKDYCDRFNIVFDQGVQKRLPNLGTCRVHCFSGDYSQFQLLNSADNDDDLPF